MKQSKFNINFSFLFLLLFLFLTTFNYGQPKNEGNFRNPELIELKKLDPTIHLDIRYATNNNFVGKPVYLQARVFLQGPAAEALVSVNKKLKEHGFGLLIFDGYCPGSVTKLFWDSANEEQRRIGFVADPTKGSRHKEVVLLILHYMI